MIAPGCLGRYDNRLISYEDRGPACKCSPPRHAPPHRYDNRLISYEDRLRSYMMTFYQRSVHAKVAKFLDMGNVRRRRRARLLMEL